MRSPLVQWQLDQIEAECALLQGHATDPDCPCETDTENCERKHLLVIEALAKEAYPMLENESEKGIMIDLADQARAWRKRVEQLTIGNPQPIAGPDNPKEPVRIERGEMTEVKVFKEESEFHGGSFRTIKPREDVIVIIGCPTDKADWIGGECICRGTGERGCTEIHSISKPKVQEVAVG
ncbi:hypothetical protein ES705_15271 [subsurface metagenome]